MKFAELSRMAFEILWVRKLRTALNLVGIVVASVLLLATLSATQGIRKAVLRFVNNSEHARKFRVYPDFDRSIKPPEDQVKVDGDMSDRRRTRIRRILEDKWREENQPRWYSIPIEVFDELRKIEHVVEVKPNYSASCDVVLGNDRERIFTRTYSNLDANLRSRILFGKDLSQQDQNEVLVHEGLAYELGYRSDKQLQELIGKEVILQFPVNANMFSLLGEEFFLQSVEQQTKWFEIIEKLLAGHNPADFSSEDKKRIQQFLSKRSGNNDQNKTKLVSMRFKVGAVFRHRDDEDIENVLERFTGGSGEILIHYRVFEKDLREVLGERSAHDADVYVEHYSHLESVIKQCREESLNSASATDIIGRIINGVEGSKFTIAVIILIVLLISAVGISNTMFISLIERTEEIGIIKAVGGSNRDVLVLVLCEGLVTGLIGGLVAIGISLLIVLGGNEILKNYVQSRANMELEGSVFDLELWMLALTLGVSTLTTTLAGIWPAWRASRLDPVDAMGQR